MKPCCWYLCVEKIKAPLRCRLLCPPMLTRYAQDDPNRRTATIRTRSSQSKPLRRIIYLEAHKVSSAPAIGRVVSASDLRSGGRGFDSRPCHVAVALEKQFNRTFPSPPTCKMGTQLQAFLEFEISACNCYTLHMG
ncbi:hypothetical protein ElyMa_004165900 [Elysia marginata]|uniref:Uncharacterized protein n=1 Tax=Elysia marginata TaxID=1093978 RepID=A0AAV4GI20_9GAST|nr:hypothetical protein ElyMa_004165900 [Elysia marginata]